MSKIGDSITKRFDLLRTDVRKLKSDIELMQTDISNLKTTVDNLKTTVTSLGVSMETMVTNMDGLAGEFKKFDEEQVLLSGRQSDHSDRIEKLEEKVFGISQP